MAFRRRYRRPRRRLGRKRRIRRSFRRTLRRAAAGGTMTGWIPKYRAFPVKRNVFMQFKIPAAGTSADYLSVPYSRATTSGPPGVSGVDHRAMRLPLAVTWLTDGGATVMNYNDTINGFSSTANAAAARVLGDLLDLSQIPAYYNQIRVRKTVITILFDHPKSARAAPISTMNAAEAQDPVSDRYAAPFPFARSLPAILPSAFLWRANPLSDIEPTTPQEAKTMPNVRFFRRMPKTLRLTYYPQCRYQVNSGTSAGMNTTRVRRLTGWYTRDQLGTLRLNGRWRFKLYGGWRAGAYFSLGEGYFDEVQYSPERLATAAFYESARIYQTTYIDARCTDWEAANDNPAADWNRPDPDDFPDDVEISNDGALPPIDNEYTEYDVDLAEEELQLPSITCPSCVQDVNVVSPNPLPVTTLP